MGQEIDSKKVANICFGTSSFFGNARVWIASF